MAENNKNNNHYKISDNDAGFEISDEFERFNQINDIFSRAFWDNSVRNDLSDAFFESHRAQPNAKKACLLYTSPSPRDATLSRMPSSA